MKELIESGLRPVTKRRVMMAVLIIVQLILLDGPFSLQLNRPMDNLFFTMVAPAYVTAGGMTVAYGVSEFAGNILTPIGSATTGMILLNILLKFVLAPLGVLFFWRYFKNMRDPIVFARRNTYLHLLYIFLYTDLIAVSVFNLVGIVSTNVLSRSVFSTMARDNVVSDCTDAMVSDIGKISARLQEHYFLPARLGGGNKTFNSMHTRKRITLRELGFPAHTPVGNYALLDTPNDTTLKIVGRATIEKSDGSFGSFSVLVSPHSSNALPDENTGERFSLRQINPLAVFSSDSVLFISFLGIVIPGLLVFSFYRFSHVVKRKMQDDIALADRYRKYIYLIKLGAATICILVISQYIHESEWSRKMQYLFTFEKVESRKENPSPFVSSLLVGNMKQEEPDPVAYLKSVKKICNALNIYGARCIVVPLPQNFVHFESKRTIMKELSQTRNVVFAIQSDKRTWSDELFVSTPFANDEQIQWGVISAALPQGMITPDRYYPRSYKTGPGTTAPDVALVATRYFLGDTTDNLIRVGRNKLMYRDYSTGLLGDNSAYIRYVVWDNDDNLGQIAVVETTDSIKYITNGSFGKIVSNDPPATWRSLYEGKIVIVDPGKYITGFVGFRLIYSNIIHQILQKETTLPLLNRYTFFITLVAILLVLYMVLFLKPLYSISAVIIFALAQGLISKWLAAKFGIIVELLPTLAGSVFSFFAFWFVRIANERKQSELNERKRMTEELQTAHDIQMGLMPVLDPVVEGFDISGGCHPSYEVGGDYYDYVWLDEQQTKFGIAIADVSGKAMKAAMTAIMTSGMIYREVNISDSPRTILKRINRPLYLKTDKQMFTAMSFAVIDIGSRILTIANAGQMHPILKRGNEIRYLKVPGARLPLGVVEDIQYDELEEQLKTGDILLFYTDGIPEAMNEKKELFGFERLETTMKEMNTEASCKEILEKLLDAARSFAGTAPQHDDMTVVVVKVI